MLMSDADFEIHWNILKDAIESIFIQALNAPPSVSYEKTYTSCYKCVSYGDPEKLFRYLVNHFDAHLQQIKSTLSVIDDASPSVFLQCFNAQWSRYKSAVGGISAIFHFLNQNYVEKKLKQNLKKVLLDMFDRVVVKLLYDRIRYSLLVCADSLPSLCSPALVADVVRCLFFLQPALYSEDMLPLFRTYIPELVEKTSLDRLGEMQAEARAMLERNRGEETMETAGQEKGTEALESDFHAAAQSSIRMKRSFHSEEEQECAIKAFKSEGGFNANNSAQQTEAEVMLVTDSEDCSGGLNLSLPKKPTG